MLLEGKRVLVTGGTAGIGFELARRLLERGAHVMVCGRDPERVDVALESLPGALGEVADLVHDAARQRLIYAVEAELGGLDVLVNNAGVQRVVDYAGATPTETSCREIAHELDVNLTAPLVLSMLAMPMLRSSDAAAIVNVTSVLATAPKSVAPVYCASKAGLASFTLSLRHQLEGTPVRVMEVIPPVVDTAMTAGRGGDEKVSPQAMADAIVEGFERDAQTVRVGKARAFRWLHAFAPGLARQMMISKQ